MSSIKQRKKTIEKAVKAMNKALKHLVICNQSVLNSMSI